MSDQQEQTTQQTAQTTAKTFTQAEMDAVAGNARKEAEARARAKLLKELGIEDVDDPKAVDAVKSKLTLAQQAEADKRAAEEAAKTETQKALDRAAALEKERDEAKRRADEIDARRKADKVDSKLERLAISAKAIDTDDVLTWLHKNKAAEVAALLDDQETFNEAEGKKLIEDVRKAKGHLFAKESGVGSPSVSGGKPVDLSKEALRRAALHTQKIIRG